ncbi:hypothetical protein CHLRE_12g543800v5 [Chlamydomonas reinhardtii]|uniref:Uncharacterized protein n=1 Tax=Chlamydomonas reinhardtii TaxID=3055 RepID=A0A2K3D6Q0_CHLRE|nr:uncharacterized protein CHLRE_12g543800v5 [Chlamydomonas reinhardtii]PNW76208.1 hypothetical protein CHLRE_12g543800v5 [Chlamydomonas reinhardtii]
MQRLDSVAGALLRGTGLARGAVCAAFTDSSTNGGSSVGFLLLGGVRSYRSSPPAASEDSDSDGSNTRSSSGNRSSQEQPTPPGAWPAQPAYSGGLRDDPGHELATGGLYESARKVAAMRSFLCDLATAAC